ncbi:hypothetical protein CTA2_8820 [Colletotrichum tanaceti]|nr:hypothetical protein CTA2_8820 [Colletotrichum tanaceti]
MADPTPAYADPLEADNANGNDVNDDADSAMGVSVLESSGSMTSSIMQYREENGRTYHAYRDGKYILPNDAVRNPKNPETSFCQCFDVGHDKLTKRRCAGREREAR